MGKNHCAGDDAGWGVREDADVGWGLASAVR
ncbi:hypothetical protein GA0115259_113539 [Streptomyces sp. MnatMP-M17]|nr:hypothetical protein GA0115259_113539 [Streptomyces sp. MnatMP-M17]